MNMLSDFSEPLIDNNGFKYSAPNPKNGTIKSILLIPDASLRLTLKGWSVYLILLECAH